MQDLSTVFFDLDGTLTDPGLGITNSVMHALRRLGLPVPAREALYKFIGPPLLWSFAEYYGLSEARCRDAAAYYREYFADRGLFENELYPAIPAALQRLKAAGLKLVVATSKPEAFAVRIVEHFGLTPYFDRVAGSRMDETRTKKAEVIAYALAEQGADPARTVMVGDREYDILGARATGLRSIGVLYGYGSREELTAAGADAIAATPDEVADLLLA